MPGQGAGAEQPLGFSGSESGIRSDGPLGSLGEDRWRHLTYESGDVVEPFRLIILSAAVPPVAGPLYERRPLGQVFCAVGRGRPLGDLLSRVQGGCRPTDSKDGVGLSAGTAHLLDPAGPLA